ncbi:4-hydroxybenzoate octaprenyltransferase [Gammaproteobacteria bacterium]|nr:4-hydroxybenzoate octaprenyltransferase [Gammaproteobacteria bacterium]
MSEQLRGPLRALSFIKLIRADRPIGYLLLLWPTLWSLWLAGDGQPKPFLIIIFTIGVFVMRSAGCVINDIFDKDLDSSVERTKNRPLVIKSVSKKEAWSIFFLLILLAFILVMQLNQEVLLYAVIGLGLTIIYPLFKRFFAAPQMVLGVTFSWCIPMAYVASEKTFDPVFYLIWTGTILWIIAYDTFYAMADKTDDEKVGIFSTARLFGKYDKLITAIMQSIVVFLFSYAGVLANMSLSYFLCMTIVACLFFYQQILIKNREPSACFKAFLVNNHVGGVIFIGILSQQLF